MNADLGTCPTGKHKTDFSQCGFAGCVDLRPWCKEHRYRWRFEQSHHVELDPHVKGDGGWFVEVICQNGLLYPYGGETVLAYAKSGVCSDLAVLGLQQYQSDGSARVFKLPVERLDEVVAVLKPKRLPGVAKLSPEHREKLKPYACQGRQIEPGTTHSVKLEESRG